MTGKHHTEEAKRKISLKNGGKNSAMYGKPGTMLGKHHSLESRKKMSASQKLVSTHYKKVSQYTKDGVFLKTYNSIQEAEAAVGHGHIGEACAGYRRYACGFAWKFA